MRVLILVSLALGIFLGRKSILTRLALLSLEKPGYRPLFRIREEPRLSEFGLTEIKRKTLKNEDSGDGYKNPEWLQESDWIYQSPLHLLSNEDGPG